YNEHTMLDPLLGTLHKAIEKYRRGRPQLYEFNLIVHYSLAWEMNPAAETQNFTFADAAKLAQQLIGDDPGSFDRIFLLIAVGSHELYQLYPPTTYNSYS
ncbi:MAG: hypothetical protein ABIP75_03810, partial [Pyrinomonadaceae bacterium]